MVVLGVYAGGLCGVVADLAVVRAGSSCATGRWPLVRGWEAGCPGWRCRWWAAGGPLVAGLPWVAMQLPWVVRNLLSRG